MIVWRVVHPVSGTVYGVRALRRQARELAEHSARSLAPGAGPDVRERTWRRIDAARSQLIEVFDDGAGRIERPTGVEIHREAVRRTGTRLDAVFARAVAYSTELEARRVLQDAGFAEFVRNQYGSTVRAGWKVEASGEGCEVRVEHAMCRDVVGDPDRISPDERYFTRLEHRDAYADALDAAGWRVRTRTVMGNESILLASNATAAAR